MKKIVVILAILTMLISIAALPAYADVPVGNVGITEWVNNDVNAPTFDYATGEINEPVVDVKIVKGSEKSSCAGVVGAGLAAVSAVGLSAFVIASDKKKRSGKKIKAISLVVAVCAVAVLATAGLIGCGGKNANGDNPYNFMGVGQSESVEPGTAGYTEELTLRKQLADFEQGFVYMPYDGITSRAPHFWAKSEPTTDYEQVALPNDKTDMYSYQATEGLSDNSNYWYVLPAADGSKGGITEARFRLYISTSATFKSIVPYDKLRIKFKAENPDSKDVNLSVYVETRADKSNPKQTFVGTYNGKSGDTAEITFDLGVVKKEDRPYVSHIVFRSNNEKVGTKNNGKSYQRNDLYGIEFYSTKKVAMTGVIGNYQIDSEYLGSVRFALYGSYSPTGMYDTADKKYKLWYGCSVPEAGASDVVWYMETTDPKLGWSEPLRITLNDPEEMLYTNFNYGGDPTVVKVDGTYYMYFSALSPQFKGNRVYMATSKNGTEFDLYGEVVGCIPEEVETDYGNNYGAGGPSVLYKDGEFWLYYYTQAGAEDAPGLTGVLLRKSEDGKNFGEPEKIISTPNNVNGNDQPQGSIDVKWMEEMEIFVACDYDDYSDNTNVLDGANVRIGISYDGVNFEWGDGAWQRPAQDFTSTITHNVGWIGDELGHGYDTMFIVYGVNYMELYSTEGVAMMDERQLEWSRVKISDYLEN